MARVFAISDTHLSGIPPVKPMEDLDSKWRNHFVHIAEAWNRVVGDDDIVMVPGDISWAMKLDDAVQDLEWFTTLKGYKVLIKGNHDYWWKSLKKIRDLGLPKMFYVQNDGVVTPTREDLVFVGTRGWMPAQGGDYEKVIERERHRLDLSLAYAEENYPGRRKIAGMHFPAVTVWRGRLSHGVLHTLMKQYGVELCTYGHLHGTKRQRSRIEGLYGSIHYHFVSCEYLQWTPKLILGEP